MLIVRVLSVGVSAATVPLTVGSRLLDGLAAELPAPEKAVSTGAGTALSVNQVMLLAEHAVLPSGSVALAYRMLLPLAVGRLVVSAKLKAVLPALTVPEP